MNLKKLVTFFALAAATGSVLAENGFEGIDVGAGLVIQNNNLEVGDIYNTPTDTPRNRAGEKDGTNRTDVNANFNVGYGIKVANKVLIGLQAALQPINSNTIPVTIIDPRNGVVRSYQAMKLEQRYDFSVLPGYMFTPSTMGYAKVGYSYAKTTGEDIQRNSLHGYVLGAGVKSFIFGNDGPYAFAEYNYAGYGTETLRTGDNLQNAKLDLQSHTGLIGAGYSF